jgi:hypothetical protein
VLAGATVPEPLPVRDLVEADLWSHLPADVPGLLVLLPRADLYLQGEVQFAFHPTLTRVWCLKGRHGQRLVEAPGDNRKVYGFGLVDWRDGWFDGRIAPGRTADVFCEQVRAAVARSKERGRVVMIIADNLKTHASQGSLLVRNMLTELSDQLSLVYTPAYEPDANRIDRTMGWHTVLATPAITTMASCIDLSYDTFPNKRLRTCIFDIDMHRLNHTDKFMPQYPPKIQIATDDLQVSITDTRQQHAYQSLTCLGLRHGVGAIQRKVPIPAHQCAHAIFPSLLKRVSLPLTRVGDLVEMTIMIGDDHMTQAIIVSVVGCDISHVC